MRKIRSIAAAGMMWLAGMASANLLVNGSFEEGPPGDFGVRQGNPAADVMTGWRVFSTRPDASDVVVELIEDPAEATDGNRYIRITSRVSGGGMGDAGMDTSHQGMGQVLLTPGVTYTVSFDAKRVSGPDNSLHFTLRTREEGTNREVEQFLGESISLSDSWTTYRYEFTPASMPVAAGKGIAIDIGFRPKSGAAMQEQVIFLDHVRLTAEPCWQQVE